MDVHELLSTVREALEFSALLHQNCEIPREEKLRYVDTIVKLLQLEDLEHTLIGRPGAGLSVEQRKRLTIGVELVVKPSILIFLDEPTSGLDGQAANNTVLFVTGLIVSELPYLVVCGVIYFVCWYWTAGLRNDTKWAGSTFFVAMFYEMLYTGIGQLIAAYAPNATFASLVNPLVITTLVLLCGVFAPYSQITAFWRYWIYYLDPFNYLFGAFLTFTTFSVDITCERGELAVFNPPANETCGDYLSTY
ncbi:ATP-binding cassette transporter ifT1 [Metarhizium robertsii ARSEF 23]|nr:ATP-binding cassette transporter ifT1 [Metarhizium robertsii ARSEF 23]KHO10892.1 ATP-binding cassette transporter ifT1 [Metarhizium robertsii ARSEF 23]